MTKVLGIDLGEKRVGIAISDEMAFIATPLKLVDFTNADEEILRLIGEEKIEIVVFGLPRKMDGSLSEKSGFIFDFVEKLKEKLTSDVRIEFEDESATSIVAEERLKKRGLSPKEQKELLDQEAAAVILESYLKKK